MLEQIILLCKNDKSSLRYVGETDFKMIHILVYIHPHSLGDVIEQV
jgi:hypothetical protein